MAKKVSDKGTIAPMPKSAGFKVTDDGKVIRAMVDTCIKVSNKLADDLHVTMVSLVLPAVLHGDVSEATRLVNGIDHQDKHGDKSSHRKSAMIAWLQAYGPFKWSVSKDKNKNTIKQFNLNKETREQFLADLKKDKAAFIKARMDETFWALTPAKEFKGFDFMKQLGMLISQAEAFENGSAFDKLTEKGVRFDPETAKDNVKLTGLKVIKSALSKVA